MKKSKKTTARKPKDTEKSWEYGKQVIDLTVAAMSLPPRRNSR
jgi:hypothetical protein